MPNPIVELSKPEVIAKYRLSEPDCGSTQVQVALLTHRIESLARHFKENRKDKHSHHGLLMMISRRRRLLKYLMNSDLQAYQNLISSLGLRR